MNNFSFARTLLPRLDSLIFDDFKNTAERVDTCLLQSHSRIKLYDKHANSRIVKPTSMLSFVDVTV
jgi:hypothetical protein